MDFGKGIGYLSQCGLVQFAMQLMQVCDVGKHIRLCLSLRVYD